MQRLRKLIHGLSVGALAFSLAAPPALAEVGPTSSFRAWLSLHGAVPTNLATMHLSRAGDLSPQRRPSRSAAQAADVNNDLDQTLAVVSSQSGDGPAIDAHATPVSEARSRRRPLASQHSRLRI